MLSATYIIKQSILKIPLEPLTTIQMFGYLLNTPIITGIEPKARRFSPR
jgi:hypothetical protein